MLGWACTTFGRIALPLLMLNAAMIASALIVGGHYLIDLPAGMLVAAVAIALARRAVRFTTQREADRAAPTRFSAPATI